MSDSNASGTSDRMPELHAHLADQLTTEQQSVLALLDGMLQTRAEFETPEVKASPYSVDLVRIRLRAAFPFLERIRDVP